MPTQTKHNPAAEVVDESVQLLMIRDPDECVAFRASRHRFIARAGSISQMDVWNDSAVWLIDRCDLRSADDRAAQ